MSKLYDLVNEYIEIHIADALDDVDCSLSTIVARNDRAGEIEDEICAILDSPENAWLFFQMVADIATERVKDVTHYCSGAQLDIDEPIQFSFS